MALPLPVYFGNTRHKPDIGGGAANGCC